MSVDHVHLEMNLLLCAERTQLTDKRSLVPTFVSHVFGQIAFPAVGLVTRGTLKLAVFVGQRGTGPCEPHRDKMKIKHYCYFVENTI